MPVRDFTKKHLMSKKGTSYCVILFIFQSFYCVLVDIYQVNEDFVGILCWSFTKPLKMNEH